MDIQQIVIQEIQKYMKNVIIPIFIKNNIQFEPEMFNVDYNQLPMISNDNLDIDIVDTDIKPECNELVDNSDYSNSIIIDNNKDIETPYEAISNVPKCSISTLIRNITNSKLISFHDKSNDIIINDWDKLKLYINKNYKMNCTTNRKIIEYLRDNTNDINLNLSWDILVVKNDIKYYYEYKFKCVENIINSNTKKKSKTEIKTKYNESYNESYKQTKKDNSPKLINSSNTSTSSNITNYNYPDKTKSYLNEVLDSNNDIDSDSNNDSYSDSVVNYLDNNDFNLDEFKQSIINSGVQRFKMINTEYL
jgi:hypothetical protein